MLNEESASKIKESPRNLTPDIVKAIKKNRSMSFLMGLMFLLMGLVFLVLFLMLLVPPSLKNLDNTGETGLGNIVKMEENRKVHYGNVSPWVIEYIFITKEGLNCEGSMQSTDLKFVRSHKPGDSVHVSYDSNNPELNKIRDVDIAGFQLWTLVFPLLMVILGLIILTSRYLKILREMEIYQSGLFVAGRIKSTKYLWYVNKGRKHPVSLEYMFNDEFGREIAGKKWSWHSQARDIKPGTDCMVLYDRSNPHYSLLINSFELQGDT